MLLFLCNFILRKTSFPTDKIGRGVAAFAAFPCSPCGKLHFRKSYARFACYFFYAILSLGKLRFPRKKLHKKSKTPAGFYFSEKIYAEREGFEPPVPFPVHLISSQIRSTTLTPLLVLKAFYAIFFGVSVNTFFIFSFSDFRGFSYLVIIESHFPIFSLQSGGIIDGVSATESSSFIVRSAISRIAAL